jgi:hypothetical protein
VDVEAERGSVLFEWFDQMCVTVAVDRLAGWIEWCRLDSGEWLSLGDVENGCESEADELQLRLLIVRLLVVWASVADGSEDPDRPLTLTYAAPEFQPAAEASHVCRVRALERDQHGVA